MDPGLLLFILIVIVGAVILFAFLQRRAARKVAIPSPYTDALHALLSNDKPRALQRLRDTVQQDTNNIDAYIRLGYLLFEMNDQERALKVHRMLGLRLDLTNAQRIEVYRALANDYAALGDIPRALECLDQILHISKRDLAALAQKQALHEKQQDWAAAFETAQKLRALNGEVSPRHLAILRAQEGLQLTKNGREREGRIRFREAARLDLRCPAPILYWGDSYLREGRIEDAVNIWKRLLDRNPADSYLVFERLANNLFELGRFNEIEQIYRDVLRTYPKNVHAYVALSKFLEKRGDRTEGIAVLEDGLDKNPESLWLRRRLLRIYGELGDMARLLALSKDLLSRVMKEAYEFTCSECGYVSRGALWHCPKCGALDSFGV
jgi:lipopolysaccharide biosynthesis regulator YciM